jgi:hypothetical protein
MPVTYQIDKSRRLATIVGSDEIDLAAARSIVARLSKDPDCDCSLNILIDVTEMATDPTPAQVRTLVSWFHPRPSRNANKVAIVVANSLHFGMARMASLLSEAQNAEVHAFLEMEKALAWLESDAPGAPRDDDLSP